MKYKKLLAAAAALVVMTCTAAGLHAVNARAAQPAKEVGASLQAQDILDGMTLHEKICQMMISYQYTLPGGVSATETGATLKNALEKYPVCGILYDASSIKGHDQLKNLVATADSYSDIPMIFCIDEEGGRVARIGKTIGYHIGDVTTFDAMQTYVDQGTQVAHDNAQAIAENIAWYGFNLDFAPVADTNSNPNNTVIGTRAYSTDFGQAADLVAAAVQGFHDGGTACTLKHFPGHGDTSGDTHAGSVVLKKTLDDLRTHELIPFQAGIDAGADCVMLAHIIVEEEGVPTLFSKHLVTDVLRDEMGFDGVVITDGLVMKAMTDVYSPSYIAVEGTKAGVDIFLCPANLPEAVNALEEAVESGEIPESRIDESVLRILQLKINRGIIK